jgi:hypothetical protein
MSYTFDVYGCRRTIEELSLRSFSQKELIFGEGDVWLLRFSTYEGNFRTQPYIDPKDISYDHQPEP